MLRTTSPEHFSIEIQAAVGASLAAGHRRGLRGSGRLVDG